MTFSTIARPRLRSPTSVANVATKAGSPTTVISQACKLPTRKPTTSVAAMASSDHAGADVARLACRSGSATSITVAQVVPAKAIIEPVDRSMPPAMITTALPRAKMPSITVCRRMSTALSFGCVPIIVVRVDQRRDRQHDHNRQGQARFGRGPRPPARLRRIRES